MPRRGEYSHSFPPPEPIDEEPTRIGLRGVALGDTHGVKRRLEIDPADFACRILAGELADEWVELVEDKDLGWSSARNLRHTIQHFCTFVDREVPEAAQASFADAEPDLHQAVTDWIDALPEEFEAGSRGPAAHAGRLRRLVHRRSEHPGRPVVGPLHGWTTGAIGLRRGQTEELDEFTRADKLALVKAAWADLAAITERIKRGRALAAAGSDPATAGWTEPANLLWAIANGAWTTEQISANLPLSAAWPPELAAFLPETALARPTRKALLGGLVRQLFLHNIDLHCFRILMMAATGSRPEEVTGLHEDDLDLGPNSLTVDFTTNRAHTETRRSFKIDRSLAQAPLRPRQPRLDPGELVCRLLEFSRPLARRAGLSPVPLFLRASVVNGAVFEVSPFDGNRLGSNFIAWLARQNLALEGTLDIRRLRKSGKVEKAIAFKGRISDIADDHSEETFRNHYAHGTTLRVIAGNVITTAQDRWLKQALDGPTVLTAETAEHLDSPGVATALGLTPEEIEDLQSGQLDMGVCSCKNPWQSPYGRPGQLCPVAPLRCFECRYALVLPSNLPQMLLFAEHLERLQNRLPPRHFDALWGQSQTNLLAALDARSDAEIALAHRQIAEDGLSLHLPLSAHVEFDE